MSEAAASRQGPNAQQAEYWNDVAGPKWVDLSEAINRQIEPLGQAAMDLAGIAPGQSVLDVGCGCGQTSLELAGRVGPEGRVEGVDLSEPMLAAARERSAGVDNLRFTAADAQSHDLGEGSYDRIFSRFGVMFFADPQSAFVNLRRALRSGGGMAFVCWQEIGRNPWMAVPGAAVARHVELQRPADPHAPGPFAFSDADRVIGLLGAAGFEKIDCQALEQPLTIGRGMTREQLVEFSLQMGPAGAAMREADDALRGRLRDAVAEAIEPYLAEDALVMDSACWIFSAT